MTNVQSLFFYITSFLVSSSFASLAQKRIKQKNLYKKKKSNGIIFYVFIALSMIIPILIYSVRYNVGIDYQNYVSLYYENANQSFGTYDGKIEIGYIMLIRLSSFFSLGPEGVFLFSAIIITSFLYGSLNEHLDDVSFFLVLYLFYTKFYAFALNGVRQAIAMSIILYSFKYMNNRKFQKFLFFVILASLFHKTSLVVIPFYIIGESKNEKLYTRIITGIVTLLVILNLEKIIGISLFVDYSSYSGLRKDFTFDLMSYLSDIVIITASLLLSHKLFIKNKISTMYVWLYFYGVLFALMGTIISFADRLGLYFTITVILIIPYMVSTIKNSSLRKIAYILVIVYGTLTFVLGNYISNSHQIIPYNILVDKF